MACEPVMPHPIDCGHRREQIYSAQGRRTVNEFEEIATGDRSDKIVDSLSVGWYGIDLSVILVIQGEVLSDARDHWPTLSP